MSWTGSEHERREQGTCRPPVHAPNLTTRFTIPAGTEITLCDIQASVWKQYTTKEELRFERYESYRDGEYQFRHEGYWIRVRSHKVKHRER